MFDRPAYDVAFHETVVSTRSPHNDARLKPSPGDITRSFNSIRGHRRGALSLRDICLHYLMLNLSNLTAESFEGLPWEIARHVWWEIKKLHLTSVPLWTMFAAAYPTELHQFTMTDDKPYPDHLSTFASLASPTFQWITHLSITADITDDSLFAVSKIPNLTVLDLATRIGEFDHRLVRNFAIHATEAGAFRLLRALLIRNKYTSILRTLQHLACLPALALVALADCSPRSSAVGSETGWVVRTEERYDAIHDHCPPWEKWLGELFREACELATPPVPEVLRNGTTPPTLTFRLGEPSTDVRRCMVLVRSAEISKRREVPEEEKRRAEQKTKKRKLRGGKAMDMAKIFDEFG